MWERKGEISPVAPCTTSSCSPAEVDIDDNKIAAVIAEDISTVSSFDFSGFRKDTESSCQ